MTKSKFLKTFRYWRLAIRITRIIFCFLVSTVVFVQANVANAFFSAEDFVRTQHTAKIKIVDTTATITVEQTIKNITDQTHPFTFYQAIPADAIVEHFFVDAQGESYELLSDQNRTSALWAQAKNTTNPKVLSSLEDETGILLSALPTEIPPEKSVHFKITYKTSIATENSLSQIYLPINDGILSGRTDIYFQIKGSKPKHFWHNLPLDGLIEKENEALSYWYWSENLKLNEPLRFYWSNQENFVTTYESNNQIFTAKIIAPNESKKFKKVSIVLDTSGSMSGNKWYLVEDLVEWILETWPAETQFQFKTQSQLSSNFLTESFTLNQRELQKHIRQKIPLISPLGKPATDTIFDGTEESDLVIFITDETQNFSVPENQTVAILSFADNAPLNRQMLLQPGFWLKLFATTTNIVQTPDLQKKFAELRPPLLQSEADFLPNQIQNFTNQTGTWFIKREFKDQQTLPLSREELPKAEGIESRQFISRQWAKAKITKIFRSIYSAKKASIQQVDDLLYLGRNYGIQTTWFNAETRQSELKSIFTDLDKIDQIPRKNWHLESRNIFRSSAEPQFFGTTPVNYYPEENIWRSIDFYDRLNPNFLVEIAPHSQAAKDLLKQFPSIFAPMFALGEQVEVCLKWKCFSIKTNHRSETKTSDRAFMYNFPTDHWAKSYLIPLVNQQIIETDKKGNIDLQKIMTRGELANIVYKYVTLNSEENLSTASKNIPIFMDISIKSPYYQATKSLSEQKIINGFYDGNFGPFERITRAQALKTIMAANRLNPETNFDWSDTPIFSDAIGWERPWVEAAFNAKKINGELVGENRYFWSTRSIKLGEVAKLLVEFLQK
jgi:hypothetical protein